MNNLGAGVAGLIVLGGVILLGVYLLLQTQPVQVEINPASFPTPVPTHTPVPTPTPTPTPHPTPAPSENAFYVAVSEDTSALTAADVSSRRYHTNERRLQLPQCNQAIVMEHPREYWHILLTPDTVRLRELTLWGLNQLGAFQGMPQTLTLDGKGVNAYVYTTRESYPCGDSHRLGLGGQNVTIVLAGE